MPPRRDERRNPSGRRPPPKARTALQVRRDRTAIPEQSILPPLSTTISSRARIRSPANSVAPTPQNTPDALNRRRGTIKPVNHTDTLPGRRDVEAVLGKGTFRKKIGETFAEHEARLMAFKDWQAWLQTGNTAPINTPSFEQWLRGIRSISSPMKGRTGGRGSANLTPARVLKIMARKDIPQLEQPSHSQSAEASASTMTSTSEAQGEMTSQALGLCVPYQVQPVRGDTSPAHLCAAAPTIASSAQLFTVPQDVDSLSQGLSQLSIQNPPIQPGPINTFATRIASPALNAISIPMTNVNVHKSTLRNSNSSTSRAPHLQSALREDEFMRQLRLAGQLKGGISPRHAVPSKKENAPLQQSSKMMLNVVAEPASSGEDVVSTEPSILKDITKQAKFSDNERMNFKVDNKTPTKLILESTKSTIGIETMAKQLAYNHGVIQPQEQAVNSAPSKREFALPPPKYSHSVLGGRLKPRHDGLDEIPTRNLAADFRAFRKQAFRVRSELESKGDIGPSLPAPWVFPPGLGRHEPEYININVLDERFHLQTAKELSQPQKPSNRPDRIADQSAPEQICVSSITDEKPVADVKVAAKTFSMAHEEAEDLLYLDRLLHTYHDMKALSRKERSFLMNALRNLGDDDADSKDDAKNSDLSRKTEPAALTVDKDAELLDQKTQNLKTFLRSEIGFAREANPPKRLDPSVPPFRSAQWIPGPEYAGPTMLERQMQRELEANLATQAAIEKAMKAREEGTVYEIPVLQHPKSRKPVHDNVELRGREVQALDPCLAYLQLKSFVDKHPLTGAKPLPNARRPPPRFPRGMMVGLPVPLTTTIGNYQQPHSANRIPVRSYEDISFIARQTAMKREAAIIQEGIEMKIYHDKEKKAHAKKAAELHGPRRQSPAASCATTDSEKTITP